MGPFSKFFSQRLEESIVAKPGVGHNHDIRLGEFHGNSTEHLNGLDMLALEVNLLTLEGRFFFFDFCFRQIISLTEGQTGPASFDHFEKADDDNILSPGIF